MIPGCEKRAPEDGLSTAKRQWSEETGHAHRVQLLENLRKETADTHAFLGDRKARELRAKLAALPSAAEAGVRLSTLYANPGFGNHWIGIRLIGRTTNRSAIGARIRIDIIENESRRSIYRHVNSGGNFGANPLRQHVGLQHVYTTAFPENSVEVIPERQVEPCNPFDVVKPNGKVTRQSRVPFHILGAAVQGSDDPVGAAILRFSGLIVKRPVSDRR